LIYDKLVDTDVLIWYLRGNQNAYDLIHSIGEFTISAVTYMELVQGMSNKEELRNLKKAFKRYEALYSQR
jgi:predicted nucleic acid-binding protein